METIQNPIPTTSTTASTRSSTIPTTLTTTTTTKLKSAKGKKSKKDSSTCITPLTVVATTTVATVVVEQKGESIAMSLDPEQEKEDLPPVVTLIKKSNAKNSFTSSSATTSRAKSARGNLAVEALVMEEKVPVIQEEEKKVGRTAEKGRQLDGEEAEEAERSMVTASKEGEGTTNRTTNSDLGPQVISDPVVLPPPPLAPTTTSSTVTVKKSKKKTFPGGGNTKLSKSIIPLPDLDSTSLRVPLQPFPLYHPSPSPTIQISKITPQEESLTVEEWYLLCGERMAQTFEQEAEKEYDLLKGKYELAREMILSQGV